jgi:hypothetical protein
LWFSQFDKCKEKLFSAGFLLHGATLFGRASTIFAAIFLTACVSALKLPVALNCHVLDSEQNLLRSEFLLSKSETPNLVAHQNVNEVVSPSIEADEPIQHWIQQDGLKTTADTLFLTSLKWTIEDIEAGQENTLPERKTDHYQLGGEKILCVGGFCLSIAQR